MSLLFQVVIVPDEVKVTFQGMLTELLWKICVSGKVLIDYLD